MKAKQPKWTQPILEVGTMVYRGHVKSGRIVLDESVALPEGAEVNVELIKSDTTQTSVWEALQKLAGTVEGLPEDMAENHDHYLYGTPKRSAE